LQKGGICLTFVVLSTLQRTCFSKNFQVRSENLNGVISLVVIDRTFGPQAFAKGPRGFFFVSFWWAVDAK